MIYAETPRLILREPGQNDLPRIVELIGEWDVARWLVSVPYPYSLKNAEEFFARMREALQKGVPEYFLIERKSDGQQIGAVGLHRPSLPTPPADYLEIGYWLGKDFWGQGFMSEAIQPVIKLAFNRNGVSSLTSTTDPANTASQNVLRKAGFVYLGIEPNRNTKALRGSTEVTRWQLTRADYQKGKAS